MLTALCSTASAERPAGSGIYVIWYGSNQSLLDMPFVVGGQVVLQWKSVEPSEGAYNFSGINTQLQTLHQKGLKTTVQINGNDKPDWMFDVIPHHPEKLSTQITDPQGTLMYWHPRHEQAYRNMIAAYADFMRTSPYKDAVLGVRMNFNALGTEHMNVPTDKRDLAQWVVPAGGVQGPAFTGSVQDAYRDSIVQAFIDEFVPDTRVFMRNNIDASVIAQHQSLFDSGQLSWFHTSSEMEPRSNNGGQYQTFINYCRSGKTTGYAEPWASAWGIHGGQVDERWCSPPQWNYWRLLSDLHCGVSHIALYAEDGYVGFSGTHSANPVREYWAPFRSAFEFASLYSGYHATAQDSPGAWVALREGNTLKGDYTFLMSRLSGTSSEVTLTGPESQPFGAWARLLPQGQSMRFSLDAAFAQSLAGQRAKVAVTYFDQGSGTLTVKAGDRTKSFPLENTGRWRRASFYFQGSTVAGLAGAHVTISGSTNLTLHMIEVRRATEPPVLPMAFTRESFWDTNSTNLMNSGFNANETGVSESVWHYDFIPTGGGLASGSPWYGEPGATLWWKAGSQQWEDQGGAITNPRGIQHSSGSAEHYYRTPRIRFTPLRAGRVTIGGSLKIDFFKDSTAKTAEWVIAKMKRDRATALASGSLSIAAGEAGSAMLTKTVNLTAAAYPALQDVVLDEGESLVWSIRATQQSGTNSVRLRDDAMTVSFTPEGVDASAAGFEKYR